MPRRTTNRGAVRSKRKTKQRHARHAVEQERIERAGGLPGEQQVGIIARGSGLPLGAERPLASMKHMAGRMTPATRYPARAKPEDGPPGALGTASTMPSFGSFGSIAEPSREFKINETAVPLNDTQKRRVGRGRRRGKAASPATRSRRPFVRRPRPTDGEPWIGNGGPRLPVGRDVRGGVHGGSLDPPYGLYSWTAIRHAPNHAANQTVAPRSSARLNCHAPVFRPATRRWLIAAYTKAAPADGHTAGEGEHAEDGKHRQEDAAATDEKQDEHSVAGLDDAPGRPESGFGRSTRDTSPRQFPTMPGRPSHRRTRRRAPPPPRDRNTATPEPRPCRRRGERGRSPRPARTRRPTTSCSPCCRTGTQEGLAARQESRSRR